MQYIDFVHLKASDLERIRKNAHKGTLDDTLAAFREWLAIWKDDAWIDHEKISSNVADLRHAGVWDKVPFANFVETIRDKVCGEVLAHLGNQDLN